MCVSHVCSDGISLPKHSLFATHNHLTFSSDILGRSLFLDIIARSFPGKLFNLFFWINSINTMPVTTTFPRSFLVTWINLHFNFPISMPYDSTVGLGVLFLSTVCLGLWNPAQFRYWPPVSLTNVHRISKLTITMHLSSLNRCRFRSPLLDIYFTRRNILNFYFYSHKIVFSHENAK